MNFSPHHQFTYCEKLEVTVKRLHGSARVPPELFSAHERYHYSMVHKLRTARYHLDTLESFLGSEGAKSMAPVDLVYRVNFHFDGFLHAVGSALDIFAREVLTYFGEQMPARVYYWTARHRLSNARAGDAILPLIDTAEWLRELKEYRNTSTHESLIGTTYTLQFGVHGAGHSSRLIFPVPDNPRVAGGSARRNPDIVAYCRTSFVRTLRLLNAAYKHIEGRARLGNILPL